MTVVVFGRKERGKERERESKENIWVSHDGGRGGAPPPTSVGSLLSRREVKKGTGREKKISKFFWESSVRACVKDSSRIQVHLDKREKKFFLLPRILPHV